MAIIYWLRRNFAQDDFKDDWYGWLTNQIGHMALGIFLALVISTAWFGVAGEFPQKEAAWLLIAAGYGATEIVRGWTGWDSIEDCLFVSGYGAGGAFLVFNEVAPGSPYLIFSLGDVLPVVGLAALHLAVGVWFRRARV